MKKTKTLAYLLLGVIAQTVPVALTKAATQEPPRVTLEVSEGRLITLPGAASAVFVADPTIADVQVPQPNRVFLFGKKVGRTTLYALGDNGKQLASYVVDIHQALGSMAGAVAENGNGADVKVSGNDTGVTLKGTAPDAATASDVTHGVSAFTSKTDVVDTQQLKIASSQQVMLKVWIGEVDRTVTKDLNFNWSSSVLPGVGLLGLGTGTGSSQITTSLTGSTLTIPSTDYGSAIAGVIHNGQGFTTIVNALQSEGLVTTLAEPTLTALSGESASFLAGGQFPIPIAQAGTGNTNTITIQFQTYGVSLNFVPTVLAPNRISLHVRPEVSQLTDTGEVVLDGTTIPGLTVRRAETTVELGSGQSFAIAGLLEDTSSSTIQKYPGLGDLPVLGALFRSSNFQHGETELVIIVTPYLVRPVDDPNRLKLPGDGIAYQNDVERILRGRIDRPADSPMTSGGPPSTISVLTGPHLAGDAGFDLE
jgi:pilus assembly protein CpaC